MVLDPLSTKNLKPAPILSRPNPDSGKVDNALRPLTTSKIVTLDANASSSMTTCMTPNLSSRTTTGDTKDDNETNTTTNPANNLMMAHQVQNFLGKNYVDTKGAQLTTHDARTVPDRTVPPGIP